MESKEITDKWKVVHQINVESEKGRPICTCGSLISSENRNGMTKNEANAKLIAAAPDLLNALQIYLNAGCKEQRKDASVIAKKAIKKALG